MGELVELVVEHAAGGAGPVLGEAVRAYLAAGGLAPGSVRVYRSTLGALVDERRGGLGADRRLGWLDTPAGAAAVRAWYAAAVDRVEPATAARYLSVLRAAVGWWRELGWLTSDPTVGLRRPPVPVDRTRALSRDQVGALLVLAGAGLRERALWRLLYETAARTEEILSLDVPDLDLTNHRAKVHSKGGAVEWVHWQSGAARLLPRLLAGRRVGPVFLTDRRAAAGVAKVDRCPATGRGRLSYRRAAELFDLHTRALAHPDAGEEERARLGGWTLHQLRHSGLTHEAEDGTSTPMLLARSRHASVRSLERYARPGVDAVAAHVARRDPAARRRDTR